MTWMQDFGFAFRAAAAGYALWRGGRPERIGGVAMAAAWLASGFPHLSAPWLSAESYVTAIDVALLGVLLALALRSSRYWPLAASAFHLAGVGMHLALSADPTIVAWARVTGSYIWGYLTVLSLIVGVALEARRSARSPG